MNNRRAEKQPVVVAAGGAEVRCPGEPSLPVHCTSRTHFLVGPLYFHLASVFVLGSVQLGVLACGLVSVLPAAAGGTKQHGRP